MHTMLNSDRALEAWFFPLAAQVLGTAELAGRVRSAGLQLASSAEDWLARSGPLDDWLVVRARILAKQPRRPAALGLANDHLLGPGGWQPHLPIELEERRALGEALTTAGLPVPPALAEALIRDGAPWARWARPLDLLEETTRTELTALLRSELHRPWARGWADRVALTKRAMAGDGAVVTRDSDPLVIACLAGVSRTILAPTAVDATLRERAHLLLQRWREWEWQDLPHAGRWSWWFGDGAGSALIDTNRWTGLVVDGEWVGWVRGRQDLAPLLGHGLKRVVLLEP